ncbi:1-hydroxycarotenoid 3,4-desaturase CrtD [Marivita sp. GX14005]|uniref:1-hydroxycarotenoid 3,4-desaturase CrtD n=1 Tax=Marivita sp. GX14005 TaxID=2942276 RepID=UPI0020187981|nr:1-hydroxycarotenoid 3,4-desaturase CrtD [Marivita sp. GX14005]MCL3883090.1 FAD-dependent oxidoreductase [Marivita sp. GX14005]
MVTQHPIVIVGAGIGGLAAALRLAYAGCDVTVLERHATPGGKLRTTPSSAGPVDAGPTVLTLRPVFEALFADVGERLEDHLTLQADAVLARHYWPDGTGLDLCADHAQSAANVEVAFGARARSDFLAFSARAKRLFEGFDAPVMQAPSLRLSALTRHALRNPALALSAAPMRTLAGLLRNAFSEPRLAQLFGRYATYVGGSPYAAPALLALIWHAERSGVWRIEGGMHRLASVLEALAKARGAVFHYGAHVTGIGWESDRPARVTTSAGTVPARTVLFNGDPNALLAGALGKRAMAAVPPKAAQPRSLSANVLSFAARVEGPPLAHHTVFFSADPRAEFDALAKGRMPEDPTLYICAQDRGGGPSPCGIERFEIIANAAPGTKTDKTLCRQIILTTLRRFGLSLHPAPGEDHLTTPEMFDTLSPHSRGSLYGRSPQGMMAAFARPAARSRLPGLYLVGGSAHPGAGLPMATLSARHAAEAILTDLTSTSISRPAAMRGGISTGSPTAAQRRSRSSAS